MRAEVARGRRGLHGRDGRAPGLATVLVGDDPASAVYVGGKRRACAEAGIADLAPPAAGRRLGRRGRRAARGAQRRPGRAAGSCSSARCPDDLDDAALTALIDPDKDVDGAHADQRRAPAAGRAGAAARARRVGVIELLDRHGVALEGAEAVVVGRSDLVGKPVAQLLLQRNATVTICHSRTRDLPARLRARRCARRRRRRAAAARRRRRQAGRGRDRRRHEPAADDGLVGDVDFDAVRERRGPAHAGARRASGR